MARKKRIWMLGIALLLWLPAVFLLLELYEAIRWREIERSNPFVQAAKRGGHLWERVDIDAQGKPSPEQVALLSSRESISESPKPVDEDHLGTRLAILSDDDRQIYASLQDVVIALYDREGVNLRVYGEIQTVAALGVNLSDIQDKPFNESPLASEAKEGIQLIRRVFDTGKPETIAFEANKAGTHFSFEMQAYPLKDSSGNVVSVASVLRNVTGQPLTELMARSQKTENNEMWLKPFCEYRKNAHISKFWYTNNAGFRSDDIALPKPPHVFRIVCIGGSSTEEGLTNQMTYPAILQDLFRKEVHSDAIVEVVNCGVVGLDVLGERRRTLDYACLQPDMAIEYNVVNDICHYFFPRWLNDAPTWRRFLAKSRVVQRWVGCPLVPGKDELMRQLDERVFTDLNTLWKVLKQKGVTLVLCSFVYPDGISRQEEDYLEHNVRIYWQGYYFTFRAYREVVDTYNQLLKKFCEDRQIIFIPLAENLHGGLNYFGDICHMRPAGIQSKAEIIFQYLRPHIEKHLTGKDGDLQIEK